MNYNSVFDMVGFFFWTLTHKYEKKKKSLGRLSFEL